MNTTIQIVAYFRYFHLVLNKILKTITFKYYFINTSAQISNTNENWTPNDLTHVFTEECLLQANFTALS